MIAAHFRLGYLPNWRRLLDLARAAAADPAHSAPALGQMAEEARHRWVMPSFRKPENQVVVAFLQLSRAFAEQDAIRARTPLCDPLKGMADAVDAILKRCAPDASAPAERTPYWIDREA